MSNFTDSDETARMIAMCKGGYSAGAIARAIGNGLTRNAVIGRLSRKGYHCHSDGGANALAQRRPGRVPKQRPAFTVAAWSSRDESAPPVENEPVPPPKELPPVRDDSGNLLDVLTIGPRQCRFPYGEVGTAEFHFCGHRTSPGESWCAYHSTIVWQQGAAAQKRAHAEAREYEREIAQRRAA